MTPLLPLRRALLVASALAAAAAVLAGLSRLGWRPPVGEAHAADHGALLVVGVFATVIALERAVALGAAWAYAAPVLSGAGAVLRLAAGHEPGLLGPATDAALAGTAALVAVNVAIVHRQRASFTVLMLLGSVTLAAATWRWRQGAPAFAVTPAWMAFFVATIAAERVELARLARPPRAAAHALIALGVVASGAALVATDHSTDHPIAHPRVALRVLGVALAGIAAWQLVFDLARRTIRQPGLPRFAAVGVLAGAGWLGVAGLDLALTGLVPVGPDLDATAHAVFVGFVLSMVFAHAPIILPAVARVRIAFHPALYVPLAVLHASLASRLAGDWLGDAALRRVGGLGNALALVLFAVTVIAASRRAGRLTARPAPARGSVGR